MTSRIPKRGKIIEIAGRKYELVDKSDLYLFSKEESSKEEFYKDEVVLMDYSEPDDHRDFPSKNRSIHEWSHIGSGIAHYKIDPNKYRKNPGIRAIDFDLYCESDWHFDCMKVLFTHGWCDKMGNISTSLLEKVTKEFGQNIIKEVQERYGENWPTFIFEMAASRFCEPLSRIWYVCNMISIYYLHQDDIYFGFLLAEYQHRMRNEKHAIAGKKMAKAAAEGGRSRSRAQKEQSDAIVSAMEQLTKNGLSVRRAAELVHAKGFGTSAEANRKLWVRRQAKQTK